MPQPEQVQNSEAVQMHEMAKQLAEQGRDEDAIICLFRALTLAPDYALARLHLGEILLRRGEYLPGWKEFEWGSRLGLTRTKMRIQAPQWNGMNLARSTLMLLGLQGYGDVIQFARYIPLASRRCKNISIGCSAELKPVIATIEGADNLFTNVEDAPPFAMYASMTSLPYIFGTTPETIPSPQAYIKADAAKLHIWRERLKNEYGCAPEAVKVGIVWAGRTTHGSDARRSMGLAQMEPLLNTPGIKFVALQKMVDDSDRSLCRARGISVADDYLHDFSDTAALVEALDLVITVDTSVAHLAGALGKPVWILLHKIPDWRWMMDREDSLWYASARLFRQKDALDWTEPIGRACEALARFQPSSKP